MTLPNGQNVNLCTNQGASAFFSFNPRFVSTWTEQASEILNSSIATVKGKTSSKSQLIVLYQLLGVMAESLTAEQLATFGTRRV